MGAGERALQTKDRRYRRPEMGTGRSQRGRSGTDQRGHREPENAALGTF